LKNNKKSRPPCTIFELFFAGFKALGKYCGLITVTCDRLEGSQIRIGNISNCRLKIQIVDLKIDFVTLKNGKKSIHTRQA
jgi:hypothetical protein